MAQLDGLFRYLKDSGGSDLHLVVGERPKVRIHGTIRDIDETEPFTEDRLRDCMQEVVRPEDWSRFLDDRDLDFAHAVEGVARFRCNFYCDSYGPGAVFRIIPERIQSVEDLGLPAVISQLADYVCGLVLVTGPSGSGKTTTLAAIIDEINARHAKHIITIEDPVEFVHTPKRSIISHRQVGRHCTSFNSGLRAAVREDPDVIMVGEMRDLETISLALTAAEMGFLVFATLHTHSASKTVDRIVDVFAAEQQSAVRGMLAGSLVAVVCQMLVRSIDGAGRVAANEILLSSPALSNAIREGNINMIRTIIQGGSARGMQLLDDALDKLVASGKADPQDAFLKATDKHRFAKYMPANRAELQ